jgi:hypothetical protein
VLPADEGDDGGWVLLGDKNDMAVWGSGLHSGQGEGAAWGSTSSDSLLAPSPPLVEVAACSPPVKGGPAAVAQRQGQQGPRARQGEGRPPEATGNDGDGEQPGAQRMLQAREQELPGPGAEKAGGMVRPERARRHVRVR